MACSIMEESAGRKGQFLAASMTCSSSIQVTGAEQVMAHNPEAVELLGPRQLPLDHPVGDHDVTTPVIQDGGHC